ncbi:MAG TPA: hypothetical protein VG077_15645 [Verrucomicrobiae bacterium]|nr:hypothetical protein [Verrucomicrobiae bacterium]
MNIQHSTSNIEPKFKWPQESAEGAKRVEGRESKVEGGNQAQKAQKRPRQKTFNIQHSTFNSQPTDNCERHETHELFCRKKAQKAQRGGAAAKIVARASRPSVSKDTGSIETHGRDARATTPREKSPQKNKTFMDSVTRHFNHG